MKRWAGCILALVLWQTACAALTPAATTPAQPGAAETAALATVQAASTAQIATVLAVRVATPRFTPTPGLQYNFDPSIQPEERTFITEGMTLARKHLGDVGSVAVYASRTISPLCTAYKAHTQKDECSVLQFGATVAAASAMFLNFSRETFGDGSRASILHTVNHEYFHVVQDYHANGRAQKLTYPLKGPPWLTEGSAEYFSWQVMDKEGIVPFAHTRDIKIDESQNVRTPLESNLAGLQDEYRKYSLGFLATEFLALNYGGDKQILQYFSALGTNSSWQGAFQETFGISIDEFYSQFEKYRQKNFPPNS